LKIAFPVTSSYSEQLQKSSDTDVFLHLSMLVSTIKIFTALLCVTLHHKSNTEENQKEVNFATACTVNTF